MQAGSKAHLPTFHTHHLSGDRSSSSQSFRKLFQFMQGLDGYRSEPTCSIPLANIVTQTRMLVPASWKTFNKCCNYCVGIYTRNIDILLM